MKHLQTIQKTFRVLQILSRIAKIFCIVGASLCAVGALCASVWNNGGQVLSLFGEPIKIFSDAADLKQLHVELLSATVILVADSILLSFAYGYLKIEQAEGTPFTENGAKLIQKLGIRCIYIPIAAVAIVSAIAAISGVGIIDTMSTLPSVASGVVLILASLIFRYGAELEQKNLEKDSDKE